MPARHQDVLAGKLSPGYLQLSSTANRGQNNRIGFYSAHSSKETCKQEVTRNWRDMGTPHPVSHSAGMETERAARAGTRTTPCQSMQGQMPARPPGETGIFTDRLFFIDFFFKL